MRKVEGLIILSVIITLGLTTAVVLNKNRTHDHEPGSRQPVIQSHRTYSLNLLSGKSYASDKPTMLSFTIQDENAHILKAYDTVHEKKLHLIVVRKDRTNFQHVHPIYDAKSGKFLLSGFNFPTDGDYRVIADFTPSDSQKDPMGIKLTASPYQDVTAGDVTKYSPQPIGNDKFVSAANGFENSIFFAPSEDSPGGKPSTDFYAGRETTIAIQIKKDGQLFKGLQNYLGALGHMVVLGPKLDYVHAHPTTEDVNNQSGLITFVVYFPEAGKYRMFLQTQASNQVSTTDFTITVKPDPSIEGSSSQSMQGMDHMSH